MRFKKYNYLTPEFYFTSSAFYRSLLPVEKWSSTLLDFEFWMKTMAVISVNKLKILKLNFEQIFTLILKISVLTFEKMQFAMPASLDGLGVFSSSKFKNEDWSLGCLSGLFFKSEFWFFFWRWHLKNFKIKIKISSKIQESPWQMQHQNRDLRILSCFSTIATQSWPQSQLIFHLTYSMTQSRT